MSDKENYIVDVVFLVHITCTPEGPPDTFVEQNKFAHGPNIFVTLIFDKLLTCARCPFFLFANPI